MKVRREKMKIKKATVIVSSAIMEAHSLIDVSDEANISYSVDGSKININVGEILGNEIVLSLEVE